MRSSRLTSSAITSSSAADEPAVTMTRSGATVDAVVVGVVPRDRLAQRGQAERRRVVDVAGGDRRAARRRSPAPASGSRARRSPCARPSGRRPRARARRSAPPSRGTARSRRRARRWRCGTPSKVVARGRREGAIVPPPCAPIAASTFVAMRRFAVARAAPARSPRPHVRRCTSAPVRGSRAGVPGCAVPAGARVAQFRRRSGHGFGDPAARRRRARTTRAARAAAAAGQDRERPPSARKRRAPGDPARAPPPASRACTKARCSRALGAARPEKRRRRPQARALDVHARARRPADAHHACISSTARWSRSSARSCDDACSVDASARAARPRGERHGRRPRRRRDRPGPARARRRHRRRRAPTTATGSRARSCSCASSTTTPA